MSKRNVFFQVYDLKHPNLKPFSIYSHCLDPGPCKFMHVTSHNRNYKQKWILILHAFRATFRRRKKRHEYHKHCASVCLAMKDNKRQKRMMQLDDWETERPLLNNKTCFICLYVSEC